MTPDEFDEFKGHLLAAYRGGLFKLSTIRVSIQLCRRVTTKK
jgi:hypothetical protein